MRLIFLVLLLFNSVSRCQGRSKTTDSTDVINQFIVEELMQVKDYRKYIPPPPPESDDGTWYSGKMKPDSIVKNLKPLTFYLNDSIWFDADFKPKRKLLQGYGFVKDISQSSRQSLALHIDSLPNREGIVLKSIQFSEFKKLLPSILPLTLVCDECHTCCANPYDFWPHELCGKRKL